MRRRSTHFGRGRSTSSSTRRPLTGSRWTRAGRRSCAALDGRTTLRRPRGAGTPPSAASRPERPGSTCTTSLQACLRSGFLSLAPFERRPYEGRQRYVAPRRPSRALAPHEQLLQPRLHALPGQLRTRPDARAPAGGAGRASVRGGARSSGVERFYMTGGEPFLRPDIDELVRLVTEEEGRELILLTNATLFRGPRGAELDTLSRERVKFQVSVDGGRPETNDPIRGAGHVREGPGRRPHPRRAGIRGLSDDRRHPAEPARASSARPALPSENGAMSQHLMWSHRRGRATRRRTTASFPTTADIVHRGHASGGRGGASSASRWTTWKSARRRVNGQPGVKYDLGNAGWDSLCVYADGTRLSLRRARRSRAPRLRPRDGEPLAAIFAESPVLRGFREATPRPACRRRWPIPSVS